MKLKSVSYLWNTNEYPIVTAIPRTDNLLYDVTAFLHSMVAEASDTGGDLELYGAVYSWTQSLGEGVKVNHFPYTSGSYLSCVADVGYRKRYSYVVRRTSR